MAARTGFWSRPEGAWKWIPLRATGKEHKPADAWISNRSDWRQVPDSRKPEDDTFVLRQVTTFAGICHSSNGKVTRSF